MLFVLTLLSAAGCGTPRPSGDFCKVADEPFEWTGIEEFDATPERPRLRLMRDNEKYYRLCQ